MVDISRTTKKKCISTVKSGEICSMKSLAHNYLMLQDNARQGCFPVNPHSGN